MNKIMYGSTGMFLRSPLENEVGNSNSNLDERQKEHSPIYNFNRNDYANHKFDGAYLFLILTFPYNLSLIVCQNEFLLYLSLYIFLLILSIRLYSKALN